MPMRQFLIFICAVALGATGWHALAVKAPEIEADVGARTAAEVAPLAVHPIDVVADGRHVTLSGLADTPESARTLRMAAEQVYGVADVRDDISVLTWHDPYRFGARKSDMGLRLTGHVPSERLRSALVAAAEATGHAVTEDLELGAGAPEGDWAGMATAGLSALGELKEGELALEGTAARLDGLAADKATRDRAERAAAQAPLGEWRVEITLDFPLAEPYRLTVVKAAEGGRYMGNAPDKEAAAALANAAEAAAPRAAGTISPALGMPEQRWPDMAASAIKALGLLETGQLEIVDMDVALSGEIGTDPERAALQPLLDDAWTVNIRVRMPDPLPELTARRGLEGPVTLSGVLPRGTGREALARTFPSADLSDVGTDARGDAQAWANAIESLAIVLPRMEEADLRITPGRVYVGGVLRKGIAAKEASSALRSSLGSAWELAFVAEEAPPDARVRITKAEGEVALSGILPSGLGADAALARLSDAGATLAPETADTLTGGGDGAADAWGPALEVVGRLLGAYETAEGILGPDGLALDGRLLPGQEIAPLAEWADGEMGDAMPVALTGEEVPADEGETRMNVLTGEEERLSADFWLPVVRFEPSRETCDTQASLAQANDKIRFVTGSAEIDPDAWRVLNRLAAVVARCLDETFLTLEIGGHTDDVGEDADNQALSERRAAAVREALAARGVPSGRMIATGFGEAAPIADNESEEGRAQNRRISFSWTREPLPDPWAPDDEL